MGQFFRELFLFVLPPPMTGEIKRMEPQDLENNDKIVEEWILC